MIYIVEDDASIRELEQYALQSNGYEVQGFESAEPFWQAMRTAEPELVILDVMLPGEDGNRLLARLRQDPRTRRLPVIMVTARGEEMDKVQGLDGGADDYIVKPFGVMELLSRVRAVLRRSKEEQPQDELAVGHLRMDVARHRVFADGRDVTLTHMEFELLRYLLINRGIALTRERLLDAVWGVDYPGDTRTVDVHMRTLRVKLGQASRYLQTVRGVGYRLEDVDAETNL